MNHKPRGEWFLADPDLDDAPVRMFCFPHAGGGPRQFLAWQAALGRDVQVHALVPPGRGHRAGQLAPATVAGFATGAAMAVESLADRPSILFGHSFGVVAAFEVARRLRHVMAISDLVASGCAAPVRLPSARVVAASKLEGRAFAEAVGFFGGLPPELVAAEELHALVLPTLQADFAMVAGYRYRPADPLDIRLHLVNGRDDQHVCGDALDGWAGECTTAPTVTEMVGGHFYFDPDPAVLLGILNDLVAHHQNLEVI